MSDINARCGFKCNLCLIYRDNLKKDERNRQRFRDGLEKYYGDKLTRRRCLRPQNQGITAEVHVLEMPPLSNRAGRGSHEHQPLP